MNSIKFISELPAKVAARPRAIAKPLNCVTRTPIYPIGDKSDNGRARTKIFASHIRFPAGPAVPLRREYYSDIKTSIQRPCIITIQFGVVVFGDLAIRAVSARTPISSSRHNCSNVVKRAAQISLPHRPSPSCKGGSSAIQFSVKIPSKRGGLGELN